MTLRITREVGPGLRATLRLEGNLVAEWAALLKHECSGLLRAAAAVSLDLTGVFFVDRAGIETLERLGRAGVEIRCRPGALANVLEGEGIHVRQDGDAGNHGWNQQPVRAVTGRKRGTET